MCKMETRFRTQDLWEQVTKWWVQIAVPIQLLVACSHVPTFHSVKADIVKSQLVQLQDKYDKYAKLSWFQLNHDTMWIKDTHCDALLFQSLYAVSTGDKLTPLLAESAREAGKFYRSADQDCYETGQSKSEISRDMFVGLFHWILLVNDRSIINRVIKFGRSKFWVMGKGSKSRTIFSPGIIGTSYQVRNKLGGKYHALQNTPQVWGLCSGYECHLQVLHIFARARAGIYDKWARRTLLRLARDYTDNALFNALDALLNGNRDSLFRAYKTLMNEAWFPNDRLPESKDRCGFYLFQREPYSNAWQPCPEENKIHTGVDFLFTAAILLGKVK